MKSSAGFINARERLTIFIISILSGILVSFYSWSILILLIFALSVMFSLKYLDFVLILFIFYIPFQICLNISPGIDLASGRILTLFLFAVWIIKSLAEKRFVVKFNAQTLLILLFLFIAIFSMLQASDIERGVRKILVFLSIFPLYFVIASIKTCKSGVENNTTELDYFASNRNRHKAPQYLQTTTASWISKIIKAMISSAFILSLVGILQFVLQFFIGIDSIFAFWSRYVSPVFYGRTFGAEVISNPSWFVNINEATVMRAISIFPDPHMFSFYLGLISPILLSVLLVEKVNKNYLLTLFAFILLLTSEFLTFSRGGYIGMIAGCGIVLIASWKNITFTRKTILGFMSFILLALLLLSSQSVTNRFLSTFNFNEGSNVERLKNWTQGIEIFRDNLLFGTGIGNYSLAVDPTASYRSPIYAHNLYLDIAAEMGVFALVIWVILLAITICQLFKLSKRTEDKFLKSVSLGFAGSLVWFSVHSFFDTPIYSPTILSMFVIILSLSVIAVDTSNIKAI